MFGARPAVTDSDIHVTYDFTGPVLGKGSFATVLRVRDRVSDSEYAVKQVRVCRRTRRGVCHEPCLRLPNSPALRLQTCVILLTPRLCRVVLLAEYPFRRNVHASLERYGGAEPTALATYV